VNVAANQVATEAPGLMPRRPSALRESFERALIRNYPGLTATLQRHTHDPQLAADLLQDAIVLTLAKFNAGTTAPTPETAGYVFRTAMNLLRNHRRHQRLWADDGTRGEAPLAREVLRSDIASLEEQSQRDANASAVRRVLDGLSSFRDRDVLVRFYLDEQSKQDICKVLELSEPDFNRIIFRARERMRRQLEGSGMRHADLFSLLTIMSLLTFVR
jgi:RNA polymerase sigma-70 factor (ECF subfamily)